MSNRGFEFSQLFMDSFFCCFPITSLLLLTDLDLISFAEALYPVAKNHRNSISEINNILFILIPPEPLAMNIL
jgi:hypothetical protein